MQLKLDELWVVMCRRNEGLVVSAVQGCSKIAETEAVVSVNEKKLLEMHMYMHVQLMQYELRGPPNPWLTVT